MAEPSSAGVVFTGQSGGNGTGQGAAAILDTHNDGWALIQSMQAAKAQEKLVAAQQKRQKAQDWGKLSRDMPDVWEVDAPYIQDELNKYSEELIKLKTSGADPFDIFSEKGREARAKDQSITRLANGAKENADFFNKAKTIIDKDVEGKYDKAHATEWFKKFTDPKLTVEDRIEMRNTSNPFKMDITDSEYIVDTVPELTELPYESFVDEAAHKSLMVDDFIQRPEYFEALKREGENIDQTATRLAKKGQQMFPKQTKARPQGSTSNNSNKDSEVDVVANATYDSSVSVDSQGRVNTVTFNYKNQQPKTIQLLDAGGNPVNAQALAVKKTPKGDAWVIVAQREVEEVVPYTPKEIEDIDEAKLIDPNYVPEPKTRKVMKTETFPIDNTEGNVGNQNYKTISGMIKQDFQTLLGDQSGAPQQETSAKKTIKRSDIAAKAKAAGYTEKEYEKLLIEKGITIE